VQRKTEVRSRGQFGEVDVVRTYLRTSVHIAENLQLAAICKPPRLRFLQEEKREEKIQDEYAFPANVINCN